jgi:hypothetical protein
VRNHRRDLALAFCYHPVLNANSFTGARIRPADGAASREDKRQVQTQSKGQYEGSARDD